MQERCVRREKIGNVVFGRGFGAGASMLLVGTWAALHRLPGKSGAELSRPLQKQACVRFCVALPLQSEAHSLPIFFYSDVLLAFRNFS